MRKVSKSKYIDNHASILTALNGLLNYQTPDKKIMIAFGKIYSQLKTEGLTITVWDKAFAFEQNYFQQVLLDTMQDEQMFKYNEIIERSKQQSLSLFYKLNMTIVGCLHKEKFVDRLIINLIEHHNLKKSP